MEFRGTYWDDLGLVHPVSPLNSVVSVGVDRSTELQVIPKSFLDNSIQAKGFCKLPLTPRRIRMYLERDVTQWIEIPIPFPGGLRPFNDFVDEVDANPLIRKWVIRGERQGWYPTLMKL